MNFNFETQKTIQKGDAIKIEKMIHARVIDVAFSGIDRCYGIS